jgi:ribonuclease HI
MRLASLTPNTILRKSISATHRVVARKNNYNNNQKIIIRGDSQLVINQIKGKYKVRVVKIISLYQKVKSLLSNFKNIKIEWIPRDNNKEADNCLTRHTKKY